MLFRSRERKTSNAHQKAADRRSLARDTFLRFVTDSGYSAYMPAMSNRDHRDGLAGSRPLLTEKDYISYTGMTESEPGHPDFEDDPVPEDRVCYGLFDVDFHMTVEQLSLLAMDRHPICIYTIVPTALSCDSDGVKVSWHESKWHTEVPNNIYEHDLWCWDGETIAFDDPNPNWLRPIAVLAASLLGAVAAMHISKASTLEDVLGYLASLVYVAPGAAAVVQAAAIASGPRTELYRIERTPLGAQRELVTLVHTRTFSSWQAYAHEQLSDC